MRETRVDRRRVGAKTGACGVRQVGAASDGDRVCEPNGGPMLPEELRPAPCECVYPRLIIPEAGEVLQVSGGKLVCRNLAPRRLRGGHSLAFAPKSVPWYKLLSRMEIDLHKFLFCECSFLSTMLI